MAFGNLDLPENEWTAIPGSDAGVSLSIMSRNVDLIVQVGATQPAVNSPGFRISSHGMMTLESVPSGQFVWLRPNGNGQAGQAVFSIGVIVSAVGGFSNGFSSGFG